MDLDDLRRVGASPPRPGRSLPKSDYRYATLAKLSTSFLGVLQAVIPGASLLEPVRKTLCAPEGIPAGVLKVIQEALPKTTVTVLQ
jgi:hypothetical protein